MMDMKTAISLPRVPASKAEAPQKVDDTSRSDSSDFDRHLTKQMEKPEPEKTSEKVTEKTTETATDKSNKNEGNQSYSDESGQKEYAENEVDVTSVTQGATAVVNEFLIDTVEAADEIKAAELVADGSDELVLNAVAVGAVGEVEATELVVDEAEEMPLLMPTDEQLMPPVGNVLPREIQAEHVVSKDQGVKNQGIKIEDGVIQSSRNLNKQPVLAEVLVDSKEAKTFEVEFKAEVKPTKEAGNQLAQTRSGLNIATLAAMASTQQSVPQATASAAINIQSATAVTESFSSLPTVNGGGIGASVQSPAWSQGLTERVTWMMQGNIQAAELKLNPAHLGPLEVKLAIQDDKASITFVTGHAQVKEAIDTAMPRLREMLEQQGLDLADVDVSHHSDDQAENSDQGETTTDMMQPDSERSVSGNESVINVNVDQGLSIFA